MTSSRSSTGASARPPEPATGQAEPWWRHGMVWLVLAGPAIVVVAGIYTAVLAVTHPDPVLETPTVSPQAAPKGGEMPAMQGRNHAATHSAR